MAPSPKHGVAVRCWTCGVMHDVRALQQSFTALPPCCFDSLADVASAFGGAMLRQLPHHIERMVEKRMEFSDAVADAAITSPNPEVRKAAQEWRNARAARKAEGNG